jgi:hypothetical protein
LSYPIVTARKNLLRSLVKSLNQENIGFTDDKFPPEKSIYLSLLKDTGIHKKTKDGYILTGPKNESFKPLWDAGTQFLENSKTGRKSIDDLGKALLSKPFGAIKM